ncbi:MAG TPA: aminotransferase class I/II-fold pyridoxal phosphate-dependent enzyme [Thermoanaerobaculia bacterium]
MTAFDSASRKLAHELIDTLFDHVENVEQRPVVDWTPAEDLRQQVRDVATPMEAIRLFLDHSIQLHHPSYMGHQVCPPFAISALGDLVVSVMNQSTAVWEMSPVATVVETEIVRWLANLAGYPETSEGTVVSGGSAANLTALLAARARWLADDDNANKQPLIITSADAHYSIARAAAIMGIPAAHVLKVATDDEHRLDVGALEEMLAAANARDDASVLAVVATSGSTATGAFDKLDEIALLRDEHRTWLHVDAAHGASVLLSDKLKHLVTGLAQADSLSWDPHKMLWMPLSLGTVLVRDGLWLRRAFHADAPYLFHAERAGQNLGEMTIQCSKRADSIKLWLALKAYGPAAFAEALERVTSLTRYLHARVASSDDFEAMHVPQFNIFCFRRRGADDETNARLREELIRGGNAWITSTVLRGQRVLRVTMMNPRTEERHVDAMLDALRKL